MKISRAPRADRAFTLVEVMVTVGIIGVLMSIAIPALTGARESSRRLVSMTNVKSIGDTFAALAAENGVWPTKELAEPEGYGAPAPPVVRLQTRSGSGVTNILTPIWELSGLWPFLIGERVEVREHYETWFSPGRPAALPGADLQSLLLGGLVPPTSYRYSNSFLARPSLWSGREAVTADMIAPVRVSDVRSPASKVLLWDADLAYLQEIPRAEDGHYRSETPMAFADGHVELRDPTEAQTGAANHLNGGSDMRLHNTPGGVLGNDY